MRKLPGVTEIPGAYGVRDTIDQFPGFWPRHFGRSVADFVRPLTRPNCGYRWKAYVVPGDIDAQTFAARVSYQDQISVTPGSVLLSVSSLSGFSGMFWSLLDKGTGQALSSQYSRSA